jgi:hypothetical protein
MGVVYDMTATHHKEFGRIQREASAGVVAGSNTIATEVSHHAAESVFSMCFFKYPPFQLTYFLSMYMYLFSTRGTNMTFGSVK